MVLLARLLAAVCSDCSSCSRNCSLGSEDGELSLQGKGRSEGEVRSSQLGQSSGSRETA